jgi:hypothetical protein
MGAGLASGLRDKIWAQLRRCKVSTHADMLRHQVEKLIQAGDTAEASKVKALLVEHEKHMARMTPPDLKLGGYYDAVEDKYFPPMGATARASRPYSYEERLAMRMQWGRIEDIKWAPGFTHVAIHSVGVSTTVHVWVITKQGQSVVLEDDTPLFPSDALITKLNMLKE